MSLFSSIWKYFWPQMRKYKGAFYSILFIFIVRTILDSVMMPLYFKKIIDIISTNSPDQNMVRAELFHIVFTLIGISLALVFAARSSRYIFTFFKINVIKELRDFAFQKIETNSYTFFTNIFSGSLVTK